MRSLLAASSSKEENNGDGGGGGGGEGGGGGGGGSSSTTHLYLNVYDLSPLNNYLFWFGLGIFHSGIEVHGMEYGFGAHEYPTSGVFEVEPRSCPGFVFRCSVWLGTTNMPLSEFRVLIQELAGKYHGDTYHLLAKNCNHFTDDVCMHLTGKRVPGWVNRLARLGSLCNCFLPENIKVTAVGNIPTHPEFSGIHLLLEKNIVFLLVHKRSTDAAFHTDLVLFAIILRRSFLLSLMKIQHLAPYVQLYTWRVFCFLIAMCSKSISKNRPSYNGVERKGKEGKSDRREYSNSG